MNSNTKRGTPMRASSACEWMALMLGKAPSKHARSGAGNGRTRLSRADVATILAARGKRRAAELADQFGVSKTYVHMIWTGRARAE